MLSEVSQPSNKWCGQYSSASISSLTCLCHFGSYILIYNLWVCLVLENAGSIAEFHHPLHWQNFFGSNFHCWNFLSLSQPEVGLWSLHEGPAQSHLAGLPYFEGSSRGVSTTIKVELIQAGFRFTALVSS